jgi:hypothetical protein
VYHVTVSERENTKEAAMKSIRYVPLLAASLLFAAGPVHAGEGGAKGVDINDQKRQKDECLLVAVNCGDNYYTLEQTIDRLQKEISKGTNVYTPDELLILRKKLENARKTLEFFRYEGASNLYRYEGE